ncbi:MAG: translation initiation factor IF-2 N-terminal domain-containing protein, partial [Thermoleophilia bacterium]|nr:translation initiation factor IF-2 N-terminal domain-containing protein [Thermoleophilia bacterium]
MAKRRVYDVAKEKGLTSHDLVELLRAAGLDVKSSLSNVEEADVERILAAKDASAAGEPVSEAAPAAPARAKAAAKKTEPVPATQAPPAAVADEAAPPAAVSEEAVPPAAPAVPGPKAKEAGAEPAAALGVGTEAEKPRKGGVSPGPGAGARKGGRPRSRGPRLEDLPTVVGP